MADQTSLQFIGYVFGAVTAAVMAMAVIAILNLDHDIVEQPGSAIVLTSSTG
jgi:hypothetical protein